MHNSTQNYQLYYDTYIRVMFFQEVTVLVMTLPEIASIFATILLFHQLFTSLPSLVELATLTIRK
jgi:hypothetical protein